MCIAANVAIFSVVDALLLRPLPFPGLARIRPACAGVQSSRRSILRRHTPLFVLAMMGVLVATGVLALRAAHGQGHPGPGGTVTALQAAIAEVEAGRKTTPLIGGPTTSGDATVTFLAKRAGVQVPRIVSDLTGWGVRADGTFDSAAGTMTRVG